MIADHYCGSASSDTLQNTGPDTLTEQTCKPPALLAENVVLEWQAKGARQAELLDYARLRPLANASLQQQLI